PSPVLPGLPRFGAGGRRGGRERGPAVEHHGRYHVVLARRWGREDDRVDVVGIGRAVGDLVPGHQVQRRGRGGLVDGDVVVGGRDAHEDVVRPAAGLVTAVAHLVGVGLGL